MACPLANQKLAVLHYQSCHHALHVGMPAGTAAGSTQLVKVDTTATSGTRTFPLSTFMGGTFPDVCPPVRHSTQPTPDRLRERRQEGGCRCRVRRRPLRARAPGPQFLISSQSSKRDNGDRGSHRPRQLSPR